MNSKLREQVEREYEYLKTQKVGSEEYNKSLDRLMVLEEKLTGRNDTMLKNIFEGVKTASGIVLPLVGLVAIMGFEKSESFTTSLRGFVGYFLPKKL